MFQVNLFQVLTKRPIGIILKKELVKLSGYRKLTFGTEEGKAK